MTRWRRILRKLTFLATSALMCSRILVRWPGALPCPHFLFSEPRQGYWQQRKRLWVKLGIKGEEGRQDIDAAQNICSPEWNRGKESEFYTANPERCDGHGLSESQERLNAFKSKADPVPGGVAADKGYSYAAQENAGLPEKTQRALGVYAAPGGVVIARGDKEGAAGQHESDGEPKSVAGTSVFDPVLCECMYRWYVPQGGKILDPFAGGLNTRYRGQLLGVRLHRRGNSRARLTQMCGRRKQQSSAAVGVWRCPRGYMAIAQT